MLFLSLYKRLPWCLKCCAFINLGEIIAFTLSTILSRIKPVQQYGQLKLVTMEMEKLYRDRYMFILLLFILFIIDEPTSKLATFITLFSIDACRKCWSPGNRRVNYSKILSSIKLLFVLSTA